MNGMQIALLIIGAAIFIFSFLLPGKKNRKEITVDAAGMTEEQVKYMVEKEIDDAKQHINEVVDETITYAMEKSERSMDRITNEKMLAINEYSDTVLGEINKNQQEVVFLYDMLNNKHEALKNTVSQANITATEIQQTVKDAEVTARETEEAVNSMKSRFFSEEGKQLGEGRPEEAFRAFVPARVESFPADIAGTGIARLLEGTNHGSEPEKYPKNAQSAKILPIVPENGMAGPDGMPSNGMMSAAGEVVSINGKIAADGTVSPNGRMSADEAMLSNGMAATGDMMLPNGMMLPDEAMLSRGMVTAGEVALPNGMILPSETMPSSNMGTTGGMASMGGAKQSNGRYLVSGAAGNTEMNAWDMNVSLKDGKISGRNNNERILELHKAGKSDIAIAKDLGLGVGEVKLVIDLFEGVS